MSLYFPSWIAYTVCGAFTGVLGWFVFALLAQFDMWTVEVFVKAFRVKRAFVLFLMHHEYRERFGEVADWKQKYKELLIKTTPCLQEDGEVGDEHLDS